MRGLFIVAPMAVCSIAFSAIGILFVMGGEAAGYGFVLAGALSFFASVVTRKDRP